MAKILVTGGAGFIGSHLVGELLNRKYEVVVLDDLTGGFIENVDARAEFIQGSILDVELINGLFARNPFDCVFHLAAYAAEGLSHFIKRFNYNNNLIGSVNLINAAVNNGIKRFVFTSSIAVYGTSTTLPMTEETPAHPEDSYGIAKLAVEQELRISREMFGLDYVVFRPHNVYGERQNVGDRYRNVVGIFMNQILQGKPMTVFGDGTQTRAFSYIGDIIPIMADAIEIPAACNQVFNVGADTPYTVGTLAKEVASAMGVKADIVHLPARNEVWHAYSSHDKVRRVFGARPLTDLKEGLSRMAAWVKDHGARSSQEFGNIEVSRNFPAAWIAQEPGRRTPTI
ncbi:MAG: NAD-dependent epimerase/dehydratase family protein [Acidobacteria bacterium]|nr:NAD-dependent epimerase/dehydratase family protein [Acidobacteriota bacterium]